MKAELEKFYALVKQIEIAMMTTRRPDGHLESRAMANQKRAEGAHLWFVTADGTGKLRDLQADPHVNLWTTRTAHGNGSPYLVSGNNFAESAKNP